MVARPKSMMTSKLSLVTGQAVLESDLNDGSLEVLIKVVFATR
jgi:hypothetical protein